MRKKTTIFVVDDHALFREGLRMVLERDPRFKVLGEASTAKEAYALIGEILPDIAVVDISLPDKSGILLTREIRHSYPETQIIIVSMHSKIDYVLEAFKAGAKGYVLKDSALHRLIEGLQAISEGEHFLDSALSFEVIQSLITMSDQNQEIADAAYSTLTEREQEMLRLLAEGMSTDEIANMYSVSRKTIENHRNNLMKKLNVETTVDLIRYASRLGLLDVTLWKS